MTRTFRPILCILGSLGLVSFAGPAFGQGSIDLKPYSIAPPQRLGEDESKMRELREGKLRVTGPELDNNRKLFRRIAESYVYQVTQEQFYTYAESGELRPKKRDQNLDEVLFNDLAVHILVPTADTKVSLEQWEYIKEFGIALDAALRTVFAKNPPAIIRVNAGRTLALVAKSGAPVHGTMILNMLTNKYFQANKKPLETPPEVLYEALRAAEGLLAAYDPMAQGRATVATRHTIPEPQLVELVNVLDGMVQHNPPVADKAAPFDPGNAVTPVRPSGDAKATPKAPAPPAPAPKTGGVLETKTLNPEQLAVVKYFRRQAVRTLAKVRFDVVGGQGGIPEARPGITLAKVAVSDVSLDPPPSIAEIGDAVIGLCGITPTTQLNMDEWLHTIGYGMAAFIGPRIGAGVGDKTVHWKIYTARIADALAALKRSTQLNPRVKPMQGLINSLADTITTDIINPINAQANRPDAPAPELARLLTWLEQNVPKDPNRSFYNDGVYKLTPRQGLR